MDKEYYYELKIKDKDSELTYKFDASINATQMRKHLREFLAAATWPESVIDNIIQEEG